MFPCKMCWQCTDIIIRGQSGLIEYKILHNIIKGGNNICICLVLNIQEL